MYLFRCGVVGHIWIPSAWTVPRLRSTACAPTRLMPCELHDRPGAGRGVCRAGSGGATVTENWARLRVSRAWAGIMTTLGRTSWLDRRTSPTVGSDRLGHLTQMSKFPEISPLQLDSLHPSTGHTCCCLLSLPFSRLFPCENRARLVEHCALSRATTTPPILSLWIFALGTGQAT